MTDLSKRIPFTKPDVAFCGNFSERDAQHEYVTCLPARVKFAASGRKGQWLYFDQEAEQIAALSPNGDKVQMRCSNALEWIRQAQAL